MSRKLPIQKRVRPVMITLPPDLIKEVDLVRKNHFSRSAWFKLAALEKLEKTPLLQGLQGTNQQNLATTVSNTPGGIPPE